MSDTTATNFFICSSLNRHTGFYQQLIGGILSFQEFCNRLVRQAETLQAFRQIDKLQEVGLVLSNLPGKQYQLIGQYYLGWSAHMKGESAQQALELVAEQSVIYRAKGLIALAGVEARRGNYEAELGYFTEALKHADNPTTTVDIFRAIAVVKAKEGYHQSALRDLERIQPLVKHAGSKVHYDYLNSLAVELCEVGRLQEAKNISQLVCRSPFAPFYKEWQETLSDVNHKLYKSRSTVRITRPIQYQSEEPASTDTAKVLPFPSQHAKSAEEFDPFGYSQPKTEVDKVLEFDTKELEATICNWVNGEVSAEELASVFMSLQSFKDAARIKDILDKMIHYIYLQTPEAKEAEAKWRSRIYVKLKPSDMDTD